jgi:hypothetical protein
VTDRVSPSTPPAPLAILFILKPHTQPIEVSAITVDKLGFAANERNQMPIAFSSCPYHSRITAGVTAYPIVN